MKDIFEEACSRSDTDPIPELDKYPNERWPVYKDEGSFHFDYYWANEYTVVLESSVRPGKSQTEFIGSFVIPEYTKMAARLLNTDAKNKFYDRRKEAREGLEEANYSIPEDLWD